MSERIVGVIGGTGLYEMEGMEELEKVRVETPFGDPSDAILKGRLGEVTVLFLPRHGRGHRLTPTHVPYRANVYALKVLGAEWVISVSAVGSLRQDIHPGDAIVVDQFIDRTRLRVNTFFEDGIAGHVEFADPVCPSLAAHLIGAARKAGVKVHEKGTYCCMEGPAFSTRAESNLYRHWGADLIGMTNLPEAKLAREAELCYATIALATDYDCWYTDHGDVTIEEIISTLKSNVVKARKIIAEAVQGLPDREGCRCASALEHAIVTDPELVPEETMKRLAPIIGRVR
ncbi:MAG: S-methyl-5'-thioadenosine phosphorylase [Deltaproteobacteria bacterium]|nr:S-methyl-5'-thioadenosine phosphorylase [Deltaproteobacteria bacterium]